MDIVTTTPFSVVYDSFLNHITSDMYMELTENDTYSLLQDLLICGIPRFEFPRFNVFDYVPGELKEEIKPGDTSPTVEWVGGYFNSVLTLEEINILALSMVVEWLGQQYASTENVRMKYSGSDFKFTSQANHMAKIKNLKEKYETECFHAQRLYKRRKLSDGKVVSTFGQIMGRD